MAEKKSLQYVGNIPIEKTLVKIKRLQQEEDAEEQRWKTAENFTEAFLAFSSGYFSLSKSRIAKLDPEECQELCENLLLFARQKQRKPLRVYGTVAIWGSCALVIILPLLLMGDESAADGTRTGLSLFSGIVGSIVSYVLTINIWENATIDFLNAYDKCLSLTDKPGALMVEHAREAAQKEIPQSS